MAEHFKRMKKYHPRKARSSQSLKKQQLLDLEHLIGMDIGSFLVLNEEGSNQQIEASRQKARGHLLKYGEEMRKLALELEGDIFSAVDQFLKSADDLIHASGNLIDPALVNHYYKITEQLENKLNHKKAA